MPSKSMANRNSVIFLEGVCLTMFCLCIFSYKIFVYLFIIVLNIVFMDFLCAQMHVSLNLYVFFVLFLWLFLKNLFVCLVLFSFACFFLSYFILMHLKRKKGCGFGGDVGKVREKLGKDKLFSEYTVWKIIFNLNHQKKNLRSRLSWQHAHHLKARCYNLSPRKQAQLVAWSSMAWQSSIISNLQI